MSKRLLILILIGVLLVGMIGWKITVHFLKAGRQGMPPAVVEVAPAVQQDWKDEIIATGTISALNGVILKTEVPGRITKIYFTSGENVKKGDPLFQIYPDILEAQLQSNQASLALAQVEYQRAAELYQKNVTSKQTLDEQTAKLKSAQAAVLQTQAQLAQHNIVAPFDGRIGLKNVDVGDYVNVGDKLVPLQQVDPLKVQFSVPDRFASIVKANDTVEINVSSAPDVIYQGFVYALNAGVNPTTRMFSMWAKIPNPDQTLLPGTYVQINLFSGQAKSVVAVPQTAVLYSPQGEYVYTVVKNVAKKVQVVAGLRKDNLIAIKGDVKPGDIVVTSGQVKLFDNTPVMISKQSTYAQTVAPQVKVISFTKAELAASSAPDAAPASPAPQVAPTNSAPATADSAPATTPGTLAPATKPANSAPTVAPASLAPTTPATKPANNNQPQASQ